MKKKYTIKEIAELANVSRATVDRVIHRRGIVSSDTYKKIIDILDKINYQPNIAAQTLKKGTRYKIGVLIPDSKIDVYWESAVNGIINSFTDAISIGVEVILYFFDPFTEASFDLNANRLLNDQCNGAVVAPVFYQEALEFFSKCIKKGISYTTFNTDINDKDRVCHVGQNLFESGKTAASLLWKVVNSNSEYLIVHINEDYLNAKHLQEKEIGFKDYLHSISIEEKQIHKLEIDDQNRIEFQLVNYLKKHSAIKGVYVTTSKVYKVAEIFEAYSIQANLIGYDLIENNINYLNKGIIDFIIFQNPQQQANHALNYLIDYLVYKKDVDQIIYLPIEIIIKENYGSFIS